MKISRYIFLVILLCRAAHLQAQSADSFVPILDDSLRPSTEFIDGESTVAQIEIVGLDPEPSNEGLVFASDFIKKLRDERIIFLNDKFSGYKVHLTRKKVKEWLAEYGYEYAKVTARGMLVPDNQIRLRFSIERGLFVPTAAIRFVGSEQISSRELEENLKDCLGKDWARYQRNRYEYFARKCSVGLFFSKGFFEARIIDIKSEIRDDVRNVVVEVVEGPRYKLGKITVDGNQVLSDGEILESFGQKTGEIADGQNIKDFVYEKLKQKYDELGYVQYNAEFEPNFHKPSDSKHDGIVDVCITIDEGRKFKIRQIRFSGVPKEKEESLLGEFQLKPGDIFSNRRLQSAIDRFNDLDRFDHLDKDLDVNLRTDEDAGEIDIVITLRMLSR